ncbi:MAG: MBL fold metallo-hydrolase [Planctomycetota bacterium]|nr:MBL fold metallo-hydrolase [Planctomycetota bacterium]
MGDSTEQSQQDESAKKNSRLKKIAIFGPLLIVVLLGLFVLSGSVYLRHTPYAIQKDDKIPAFKAAPKSGMTVRYLGVTGYEITDGQTTVITDPMVNRFTAVEIITGKLNPDPELSKKWVPKADYILVNHAHYDHSIDAPEIALRTGATVIGSQSVINLCISRGVKKEKTILAKAGARLKLGTMIVDIAQARHGPIFKKENPMWGTIPADSKKLWFFQYTMDDVFSYRVEGGGTSVWFHPSTNYKPGELNKTATSLIMGVNGVPITPEGAKLIMKDVQPVRIIPTHFDNFFQPITKGLCLMPGLDLNRARDLMIAENKNAKWLVLDYDEKLYLAPDSAN